MALSSLAGINRVSAMRNVDISIIYSTIFARLDDCGWGQSILVARL